MCQAAAAPGSLRRTMRVRAIIMTGAILALGSACSSDDPSAPPPACDTPQDVESVSMGEFFYEPVCVQAENGTTIEVVNEGDAPHTYTVEGTDLESNLSPRDTGELTFQGLTPGTIYEVTCDYHSNMTAALEAV